MTPKAWVEATANGRFRVRMRLADGRKTTLGDGKTFATRDEAEVFRLAVAEVTEAEASEYGLTVAEFGRKWLVERELARDIRDPRNDRSRFENHIESAEIGRTLLKNLRRGDVIEWSRSLRRKVARQTALNVLTVLRGILRTAYDRGLVKANVAADVRLPREARTEETWHHLIPEEQQKLLACLASPERHIVQFAMGTGLRAGELVTLRLRDVHVDIEHPHVVVRYGRPPSQPTKSGRIREVPLFGLGLDAARAWLDALPGYAPKNPHGLMFPRPRGGYRDPNHVLPWRLPKGAAEPVGGAVTWRDALDALELDRPIRWHDLRHTCGSSLVSGWWGRAWSIEEVQAMLGHSSVTVTERYAKLASTALRRAASETRVAPRLPLATLVETGKKANDFAGSHLGDLNPRPAVYENAVQASSFAWLGGDRGKLGACARALLEAVAGGDDAAAERLASELAAVVLSTPEARLALAVSRGGPLAITRAIELAEAILAEPFGHPEWLPAGGRR